MSPNRTPMWRRGIVNQVDASLARVKVLLPDEDQVITDWLPLSVPFALGVKAYWVPRVGSQVVCLLDEHGEDGVVLGALYSHSDDPPATSADKVCLAWPDGTTVEYDEAAHELKAVVMGTLKARCIGKVTIQSMDGLDFSGAGPVNLQALDDMQIKASGKLVISAYDSLYVNAYSNATIKAEALVSVLAPQIALQAAAGVTVTAPSITFNGNVSVNGAFSLTGAFSAVGTGSVNGAWSWI